MARSSSTAKSTNRLIGLVAALAFIAAALVAGFGTKSTPPEVASPEQTVAPSTEGVGTRPAETALSSLLGNYGLEQYDFKMESLNCAAINKELSLDLCAVAKSKYGDFMFTGIVPYVDETDTSIFFEISLYTFRTDTNTPRAVGIKDGYIRAWGDEARMRLDVFRTVINGDEVLIVHKHPISSDVDGYDNRDHVLIIAASPTGDPTEVAHYVGPHMEFESDGENIFLYWKRYGVKDTGGNEGWITVTKLFPSTREVFGWNEETTSAMVRDQKPGKTPSGSDVVPMKLVDTWNFPSIDGGTSDNKENA